MSLSHVGWALVNAPTAPGKNAFIEDLLFKKLEGIHRVQDLGIWSSHREKNLLSLRQLGSQKTSHLGAPFCLSSHSPHDPRAGHECSMGYGRLV